MKIRKLKINNFRGIKELEWDLPAGDVICLIGKGDSAKSTILESIRYVFYPQWNLLLTDSDFYQCKTNDPIVIEVTLGELSEEFFSLNKYGKYLRGWDASSLSLSDEPDSHLESVLTVRLTVGKNLEPKWTAVCDRNPDGVEFRTADRQKTNASIIGIYSEKQFSWANGTPLSKLTETQSVKESLADASRVARSSFETHRSTALKNFDETAQLSEEIAKLLGVPVKDKYKAHLDLNSISIKIGGLTLHDGEIPLRQLGLGSRRMLLCGIQQRGLQEGHITLFDEIEFGLEPHRIARLIKHIRDDKTGQYFLTTHSPTVLRELTVKELFVVHNNGGSVRILQTSDKGFEEHGVQGKMRSSAEAFLAKKVIICEGATEVGFLRGFDDYQLSKNKNPLSYRGAALLDVHGAAKIKTMAQAFNSLHYPTAVLADGDAPIHFSEDDETELREIGVDVQVWSDKLSLEERAMMDLPWDNVLASVKLAGEELSYPVFDNICSALKKSIDSDLETLIDCIELRVAIGEAAKKSGWFKDITRGDRWFRTISSAFIDPVFLESDLATKLNNLWAWVERD